MSLSEKRLQLLAKFKQVRGSEQKLLAMRIRLLDWAIEKSQIKSAAPALSFEEQVVKELF